MDESSQPHDQRPEVVRENFPNGREAPAELLAILLGALPAAWQGQATALVAPKGFVLRFVDAQGRRHEFEARAIGADSVAVASGQTLEFAYTLVDPAVDEASVFEAYRAVLEALVAREADLLPWLPPDVEAAPRAVAPIDPTQPFPNERPAPPELAAALRDVMPERWRGNLRVTVTPGCFVVRFTDERGAPHAFDARAIRPGEPALVSGPTLAFSYLAIDGADDEGARADEYRDVLTTLSTREADLLPWLPPAVGAAPLAAAPVDPTRPFPNEQPAPPELAAALRDAMPERWRGDLRATVTPGSFVLRFTDERGDQHAFDARPIRSNEPTLVSGPTLAYSYLFVDGGADETTVAAEYRDALRALAAREHDFLPWLPPAVEAAPLASAPIDPAHPFPNERSAPPELTAFLRDAMPERWRGDLRVTVTPQGFVVRFTDQNGDQHAFDARAIRPGEPTLVSGASLAYSYLFVDGGADETTLAAEYRDTLRALAAREPDFLPWLSLDDSPAAPVAAHRVDLTQAFLDEQPAPPELAAVLRDAMPERWRHDLRASVNPDGFVLRFTDERGGQHAFDARTIRPGEPTLVSGAALAYSYLFIDGDAEETTLAAEYRDALRALAVREPDILPWIRRAAPAEVPWLPGAQPASRELAAMLTGLLPAGWRRDVEVLTLPEPAFWVRCRTDGDLGSVHAFEVRPLTQMDAPLVTGARLGYGHGPIDPRLDERATLDAYRQTLAAFAAREADILAKVSGGEAPTTAAFESASEDVSRRPTSWGQGPDDFPDRSPAPATFVARVTALLPPAWREGVGAALFPGGFTVEFKDATGVRHKLEARLLEGGFPALVRGQRLGFSYLKVDAGFDEGVMVPRYREALHAFIAHEAELAAELRP